MDMYPSYAPYSCEVDESMNPPSFRAYIEKRRLRRGHGWFCITRHIDAYSDARTQFGPFRLKRDAKLVKDSAKKSYAESKKGF